MQKAFQKLRFYFNVKKFLLYKSTNGLNWRRICETSLGLTFIYNLEIKREETMTQVYYIPGKERKKDNVSPGWDTLFYILQHGENQECLLPGIFCIR